MASSENQDAHAGGRAGKPAPEAGQCLSGPDLAGLGREVGPGRGQEVLALPDAQVSSLGSCIHKIYSEYLDCIFLETHDLIINYCHRKYVFNKVPTKFSVFFLQSISQYN